MAVYVPFATSGPGAKEKSNDEIGGARRSEKRQFSAVRAGEKADEIRKRNAGAKYARDVTRNVLCARTETRGAK